jgi:cytochrome P450
MTSILHSIPRSLLVFSTSSIALVVLFSTHFSTSRKKLISKSNENDSNDGKNNGKNNDKVQTKIPPPMCKAGMIKTAMILGGPEAPWFVLNTAREIKSYVYRINLHQLFGCPMFVIVGEPKVAREIYLDPLTSKPEIIYSPFNGVTLKPSMFTQNGSPWHSRRKGMAPAFSSKHVRRMNKVASDKVHEWIEARLDTFIENDEAFDVGKEMIGITLSTISEAAFEYEMSDHEKETLVEELELCLAEFCEKSCLNPLRKFYGLFIKERRRAHIAAARVQTLSLNIIKAYKNLKTPIKDTVIDRIMNNNAYANDDERAADITIILIAGHDTTAFTMAWILKELAKNPMEQQKLRDSLDTIERKNWGQSEALQNIVKEGMRLFPVAGGGSARKIGRDIETDDGFILKKGSIVSLPGILLNRNTDIFEDADSFIPSRWDKPTKDMNDSVMNFALGKQNCVGQSLANAEIHTLIPLICSKFELELEDEGSIDYSLTLKPINTLIKAKKL